MRYVPYKRLGNQENIIVDGKGLPSTVLTLSHWRESGTPAPLKADLSAEIVFKYLENASSYPDAEAASNNHFDEDGLTGLYAIINPDRAFAEKDLLIDIATAGDFGTYRDRDAARVSFVLQAWAEPDLSPLNHSVFQRPYDEVTSILYEELLPRLTNIMERIHYLEKYWSAEDTHLDWSEQAIRDGHIQIRSAEDLDFAVVEALDDKEFNATRNVPASARFTHQTCHQFAVHNQTQASRILVGRGRRYDFYYRYETWVETVERKPLPRLDLKPLARLLSSLEKNGATWKAEDVNDLVPHLYLDKVEESSLELPEVEAVMEKFFGSPRERGLPARF